MLHPSYKITLGSMTIDSTQLSSNGTLVSINTAMPMNSTAGIATIVLSQVIQHQIQRGDPVTIELGYEDQITKVLEGIVVDLKPNIETIIVTAYTSGQKLLELRLNQTYENQTAGAIVSDLAGQVGIGTETIEDGISFPFYVIDAKKNCFEHLHDIAQKCGFDLYLNVNNKLIFKKFQKSAAAHTLCYGKNIISIKHIEYEPDFKNVVVLGESPASSKGSDTSHWLTKSFDNFKGITGTEAPVLVIQDATIRTKEAADKSAKSGKDFIERKKQQGMIEIIGNPKINPGDIVEIKEVPQDNLNGLVQVRSVSHILNKDAGFITTLHFWGVGE